MSLSEIDDMAATCIVCLGDLKSELHNTTQDEFAALKERDSADLDTACPAPEVEIQEMVAHLPCGHNLHDDCVKPWVERTNSCPICRQIFNKVELSVSVGGKYLLHCCVLSNYANYCFFKSPYHLLLRCSGQGPRSRD